MLRRSLLTPSNELSGTPVTTARVPRRVRLLTQVSGVLLVATLAGCGQSEPKEPSAKAVQLRAQPAKFSSTTQRPGDIAVVSLTVTNVGQNPVDHLTVTLEGLRTTRLARRANENPNDVPQGTTDLPNTVKRAAWFVDNGPNLTPLAGGDTWDGGPLAPGHSKTLRWEMAALTAGQHTLKYYVTGGLTDAVAKKTTGTGLTGTLSATILKQ